MPVYVNGNTASNDMDMQCKGGACEYSTRSRASGSLASICPTVCKHSNNFFLDQSHAQQSERVKHISKTKRSTTRGAIKLTSTCCTASDEREESTTLWCTAPPGCTLGSNRIAVISASLLTMKQAGMKPSLLYGISSRSTIRRSWGSRCSRIRRVHFTYWSVLLRRPQHPDHIVEATKTRTSGRKLDTRMHHRGSLRMHMEPRLLGYKWQYNEHVPG